MEKICQSCGMPMKTEKQMGTNADGTKNEDYCGFCFKLGQFTRKMTLEEFSEAQVKMAIENMNIPEEKAQEMAQKILPNLKRWR
jgi:hypothetical protein